MTNELIGRRLDDDVEERMWTALLVAACGVTAFLLGLVTVLSGGLLGTAALALLAAGGALFFESLLVSTVDRGRTRGALRGAAGAASMGLCLLVLVGAPPTVLLPVAGMACGVALVLRGAVRTKTRAATFAYGARPVAGAGAALLAFAALFLRRDVVPEIVGAAAILLGASVATAALILAATIHRRSPVERDSLPATEAP